MPVNIETRTAFEIYSENGAKPVVEQMTILGKQLQRVTRFPK